MNVLPGVPIVESPLFSLEAASFDAETRRIATDLHENGFAVLRFPEPDFDAIAERIKDSLSTRFDFAAWRDSGGAPSGELRLLDAWVHNQDVKRIAANAAILELLSRLYGRRAFPFQTLSFPVGSQQHIHSDAVHFSSIPERFMCGVWVALENVSEEAGPLLYHPTSHRLPIFTNEHIGVTALANVGVYDNYGRFEALWSTLVKTLGLEATTLRARKGDALIWAANLLHGGAPHLDPRQTRWSQVTHYYFERCAYYTPLDSDPFCGRIRFRNDVVDISTGQPVPSYYVDREVPSQFIQATSCDAPIKRPD